jgi:hypothetical protein
MEVFFSILFHEEIYQKMQKPFSQPFRQTQSYHPNTNYKVRAFLEPGLSGKRQFRIQRLRTLNGFKKFEINIFFQQIVFHDLTKTFAMVLLSG